MRNIASVVCLLLLIGQVAHSQSNEIRVNSISEKASRLEIIQVTDEKDEKEESYEAINSETVIPKDAITKGNTRDVNDLLQKVPGVSVSGGGELQNKKVSIRGLDGYRVIQQVDGAQRLESTQSGMSSGIAVEPEMLTQISVQNGADSVGSIHGAIGGTIHYKTITPEDVLIGKKTISTKLKISADSATEGMARSLHSATRLNESSSVLLGVTIRDSSKAESGAPSKQEEVRDVVHTESQRATYLGKYVRDTDAMKTDVKAEFSQTTSDNAAFYAGYGTQNSDYRSSVMEAVVNHEHNLNSHLKYEVLCYFNSTESIKNTHKAFRGVASTVGKTTDRLDNAGTKLAAITALPLMSSVIFQSKNGVEGAGSRISEDDGTSNPYFGKSQGYDVGLFTENSLSWADDTVVLMAAARTSRFYRQSEKLALESPSKDGNTMSTMVGLSYSPAEWIKFSGKLGVANRAPNVRELYLGTGETYRCHRPSKECSSVPNPNLNEEAAHSKEISVLLKAPGAVQLRRLKLTYFDEDIGDYIEYMPEMYRIENGTRVPAGPANATHREYKNRNLSNVLRRGVEAQAQMDYNNWEFEAMYSMVRMDCLNCPDMYTATTVTEPMVSAPADKYGLAVGYEFPSINFEVGADAQFVSAQKNLSERYLLAGYGSAAYDVYGINMKWSPRIRDFGVIDVGLGVSNVLDTKYVVHNSPSGTFELGRNYSLSLATIF